MPPRKPRASTVAKAQEGLAAFLAAAGVDSAALDTVKEQFANTTERDYIPREHHDYSMLQAEGVLLIAESMAKALMHKKCKRCGEVFMTRYNGVAYCSDLCRGKAMEAQIGIRWNYRTDRYAAMDVDRPLVVGPAAYQALMEMARRLVEGHQLIEEREEEKVIHQVLDEVRTIPEILPPLLTDPVEPELSQSENPFDF